MAPSKEGRYGGKHGNSGRKKHQDDGKSFSDQRKRIYLVNIICLKQGKMQRSRLDKNVVVTVISQRFVVSEYGKM